MQGSFFFIIEMVPAHDERSPGSTKTCYSKWIEHLVSAAPMWRLQSWHLVLWANIWVKLGSAIVLRFLPYIILCFFWGETRLEKRLTDIRKSRHKLSGSRFGILHCHSTYFFGIKFASGYTRRNDFYWHRKTLWSKAGYLPQCDCLVTSWQFQIGPSGTQQEKRLRMGVSVCGNSEQK